MAKKTTIQARIDKEVKEEARELAGRLGLSLSDVVQVYLRTFVRERGISAYETLCPTKKLGKILREAERDIRKGKNLSPPFSSPEEIREHFESLE